MKVKDKIYIVILAIAITLVFLLVPKFWVGSWEQSIILGATLLAACAGVFAIILGYFIYKDLGVRKLISDKQVNCVFSLLEELSVFRYQVLFYRNDTIELMIQNDLRAHDLEIRNLKGEDLSGSYLLFNPSNYFAGFEKIRKIIANPAMPRELLEKLNKNLIVVLPQSLIGVSISEITDENKWVARILFPNEPHVDDSWFGLLDGKVEVGQFLEQLTCVYTDTRKWVEVNATTKLN